MFRIKKTREAISYLLEKLGGKSTYGAITKLLYIADRESMYRQGRSITGDTMCALPQGPILSVVLDRLNGSHADFADLVSNGQHYEVKLLKQEDPCEQTFSDLATLDGVLKKYGSLTWEQLKAETHKFGEWKKYDKGQETWSLITPKDVAEALGFSAERTQALLLNIEERDSIATFCAFGELTSAAL